MERKKNNHGIDTVHVLKQARALRAMHQSIVLGNLVDAIILAVRRTVCNAGRATG